MIWTGSEAVTVTYRDDDLDGDFMYAQAAAYSPATDTWRTIAVPTMWGNGLAAAIWTGQEILLVSSLAGTEMETTDGRILPASMAVDLATGCWRNPARPPSSARFGGPMVWTGEYLLVPSVDGAAYNPYTDAWLHTPGHPAPWSVTWVPRRGRAIG